MTNLSYYINSTHNLLKNKKRRKKTLRQVCGASYLIFPFFSGLFVLFANSTYWKEPILAHHGLVSLIFGSLYLTISFVFEYLGIVSSAQVGTIYIVSSVIIYFLVVNNVQFSIVPIKISKKASSQIVKEGL